MCNTKCSCMIALAHLAPSIVHQTSSAPVCYMVAEHTLGLADYLFYRKDKSKVPDGKEKCKINGHCSGCQNEQECFVKFCIKQIWRVTR